MTASSVEGMAAGFRMELHNLDGFVVPAGIVDRIASVKSRPVRDNDIFLITFPKSGTHWVWEIINMLMVGRAEYAKHWQNSSFIESLTTEEMEALLSPRILFTHLLPRFLPTDTWKRGCRVVTVRRNPKDAVVSFYHQHKDQNWVDKSREGAFVGNWDNYVQVHMNGSVPFGSVIDHCLTWDSFLQEHKEVPHIKLQYEDMKKNVVAEIRRLADFLERPLPEHVYQEIAEACCFEKLKHASNHIKDQTYHHKWREGTTGYFRKGEVGDWKTMFTVAQSEQFDEIFQQKHKRDYPM